jgi:hypothetical protein
LINNSIPANDHRLGQAPRNFARFPLCDYALAELIKTMIAASPASPGRIVVDDQSVADSAKTTPRSSVLM